jgi:RNA polymerase sigma-70 factor (ECF subfamily)
MFSVLTERAIAPAKPKSKAIDFEAVVAKYGRQVYNIAYRMTGDRHEAEDLMQEAFFKAFRSLASLKDDDLIDRWLYRIVSNAAIDYLRRKPRRTILSLNDTIPTDDGELTPEIADWSTSPETKIEAEQFEGNIQKALSELPEEFRLCLILCDVEGLSYEDISQTLGCNIGTVRSRIHRARKAVREKLQRSRTAVIDLPSSAGSRGVSQ